MDELFTNQITLIIKSFCKNIYILMDEYSNHQRWSESNNFNLKMDEHSSESNVFNYKMDEH